MRKETIRIAFHTLGCKVNYAETSFISQKFKEAGYSIVPFSVPSDIYVINTCSVTHAAVKKSRYTIQSTKRKNPDAHFVVTGCITETEKEDLGQIEGISLIVGANDKSTLFERVDALVKGVIENHDATLNLANRFFDSYSLGNRTRAFIKVQDGCNYFCSYCVIPYARGRSRSSYTEDIAENVKKIIQDGVKEIVVTGINIGDFNNDKGETLHEVLNTLSLLDGMKRLRLSSIEPDLLSDEIISLTANSDTLMPHFHLPLQSGSDKILKAMNRKYDTAFFERKVNDILKKIPDCSIGTDLIVGFPDENDSDFEDTLNFITRLPLSYIHVFPFSKRKLTKAARFPNDISPIVKKERVKILSDLAEKKKTAYHNSQLNKSHRILFESTLNKGYLFGFTENYIKVKTPFDKALTNKIIETKITVIDKEGLFVFNPKNA